MTTGAHVKERQVPMTALERRPEGPKIRRQPPFPSSLTVRAPPARSKKQLVAPAHTSRSSCPARRAGVRAHRLAYCRSQRLEHRMLAQEADLGCALLTKRSTTCSGLGRYQTQTRRPATRRANAVSKRRPVCCSTVPAAWAGTTASTSPGSGSSLASASSRTVAAMARASGVPGCIPSQASVAV